MDIQYSFLSFNHSFIHLRFFFPIFFKHTVSAMAKQLASVSPNMLAKKDQTSAKLLRKNIAPSGDTQQYYCAVTSQ
jgi:hypothetical protein